jgi:butyryl-CoA dehydrogenase
VAIIGGSVVVAVISLVMLSDVDQLTPAQKSVVYRNVYLAALSIPVISVLGVIVASLLRAGDQRRLVAQGMSEPEARRALADATLFLDLVGHLCLAWTWLRLAVLSERALQAGAPDRGVHLGRLATCRHVFAYELPPVLAHAKLLQALAADTLDLDPDWL